MAESSHRQQHRVPASCCRLPVSPARGHLLWLGVVWPGRTPRLSMQVSLLVGHSQPGPSQPLSHTQAPLEQRPRSARGDVTALRHSQAPSLGFPNILGCILSSGMPQSPLSPQPTARSLFTPLCQRLETLRPAGTGERGSGVALTVAEEAGGARALQDVVLAEVPVEALRLALEVALALPAETLAPARAHLVVPRADAVCFVGGQFRGAVARVPLPDGEEMALREAGAGHGGCPQAGPTGHKCAPRWVARHGQNPQRGTRLSRFLTSLCGRCTVHR